MGHLDNGPASNQMTNFVILSRVIFICQKPHPNKHIKYQIGKVRGLTVMWLYHRLFPLCSIM